jgi:hypothetical protein
MSSGRLLAMGLIGSQGRKELMEINEHTADSLYEVINSNEVTGLPLPVYQVQIPLYKCLLTLT